MTHLAADNSRQYKDRDVVYTPKHIALELIKRYKPTGKVLDPCDGNGSFSNHIPGCLWCEISRGKDFFDWHEQVDWIIGNPPYSILNAWLDHSFEVAENIVYLLPIAKVFSSRKRLISIKRFGGLVEIYAPWQGRQIGFDFGWASGAVWFQRGFKGEMRLVV